MNDGIYRVDFQPQKDAGKGIARVSNGDYWRDSFGAKTNINRIEDAIAWGELPRPFHLPSGQ